MRSKDEMNAGSASRRDVTDAQHWIENAGVYLRIQTYLSYDVLWRAKDVLTVMKYILGLSLMQIITWSVLGERSGNFLQVEILQWFRVLQY